MAGITKRRARTAEADGKVTGTVEPPVRRRRGRRWKIIAVATVGVIGAAAAAGWATGVFDNGDAAPTENTVASLDTAEVVRGDLVQSESVAGQLGYGDGWNLSAEAPGTVTALPDEGATLGQGDTLYEVDAKPVTLMIGLLPMYRTLGPGDDGLDVEQLERNLAELGYTGFTADDEYTSYTAAAVEEWQEDRGLDETGRVDPSQVVFAAGTVRVAGHVSAVGEKVQPGEDIVQLSSTTQVVTIDLDIADRDLVVEDGAVTIDLPDGSTINGHIAQIGTVATTADSGTEQQGVGAGGGGESTSEETTIEVIVTIDDGESTGIFDQAPVEVDLESNRVEDVLSVPVAALLATAPGQYAVEAIEGATKRLVPVETGTFASGWVEISGPGIAEGTLVGVPQS